MYKQIAFLGPKATFTDIAVSRLFPNDYKVPLSTIPDCLDAVNDGEGLHVGTAVKFFFLFVPK